MARPKTKGEPFICRLPLEADRIIRERAEELGKTPSQYVEDSLVKAAEALAARRSVEPIPKGRP